MELLAVPYQNLHVLGRPIEIDLLSLPTLNK